MSTHHDGTHPNPPLLGSLVYLVSNLPIGIASFVFVVTTVSVGLGTVVIWVGVAVLAVAMLVWRGLAQLERTRVHRLLGTYVATPYRPLPEQTSRAISARMKDPATYKDLAYHLLMLPIGIAEFTIVVTFWATALWLTLCPAYYLWLPADWTATVWDYGIVEVDSWPDTLPWAALGLLVMAIAVKVTRALGSAHAVYARALLGPSERRIERLQGLDTAGVIDWTDTTASVTR